jgi:hypothetical protein
MPWTGRLGDPARFLFREADTSTIAGQPTSVWSTIMTKWLAAVAAMVLWSSMALAADEYRIEKLEDGPPADDLAAEVIEKLQPTGFKVVNGDNKSVAEIWLAKELAVKDGFEPTLSILYPLETGSLVGALRFPLKGSDFRGQEIARGTYTLRYGQQPVDGNHVGTFDTQDFLLLLPAASDRDPATLPGTDFFATSAEAAGSTHPAIMPLLKPTEGDAPALRHIEEAEWWAARLPGNGGKVPLELIVVGKAAE